MRIATATISHETNTFADGRTELDDFETATGESLLNEFDAARSLSGIVDALDDAGVEVVPTVGAATLPSPTVTPEAFEWMYSELLDRLDPDVDGVCLDLHGSMYVSDEPDPEGALLAGVRDVVGPDVPVTAALDMHATITERMIDHLDGVAGYRTAPHTDVIETGERAADILLGALAGDDVDLGWERLPMLLAGERSETAAEPMATLVEQLRRADERDGILDANYFLGFPWADSPHAGCHAVVTGTDGVDDVATELGTAFWERRREFDFTTEAHGPETALDVAAAESEKPVVVAETGDIPGAGASEDLTDFLLLVMARDDLGTPVLAVVADSDSYERCVATGTGERVTLELGRRRETGEPLSVSGLVCAHGEFDGVGVVRVVDIGYGEVLIAEARTNCHRDPATFEALGIDPTERRVVVLKSGYLSQDWQDVAARRLFALTDGDTNQRLEALPYEHVPRPIYPIDERTEWSA